MEKRSIVKKALEEYYKTNSIIRILQGKRRPRYEVMLELHKKGIVPFCAWTDIKEYLEKEEKLN